MCSLERSLQAKIHPKVGTMRICGQDRILSAVGRSRAQVLALKHSSCCLRRMYSAAYCVECSIWSKLQLKCNVPLLIFCLDLLPIVKSRVLKCLTIIVLSISPFRSVKTYLIYLCALIFCTYVFYNSYILSIN